MAKLYTKNTWVDELLATNERYDISQDDGTPIYADAQIVLSSTVAQAGTAVDAARMNNIEDGLDAVDTLLDEVNTELVAARGGSADLDTRLDSLVQTQIAAASTDDTPADADVFGYLVSGVLKKFTWANIKAALKTYFDTLYRPVSEVDGWTAAGETWTYASAVTFTVSGDQTAKYTAGVKIKLTQTTAKYFYVVSSSYGAPNTTVTVTGGSDYTLANAAITNPYYSRAATPSGFPDWFAYTCSWTGSGGNPTLGSGTKAARFRLVGKSCLVDVQIVMGADTNFGTGNYAFSLPFTAANLGVPYQGQANCYDSNTSQFTARLITIDQGQAAMTYITPFTAATTGLYITPTVPFTWASGDILRLHAEFEVA